MAPYLQQLMHQNMYSKAQKKKNFFFNIIHHF